MRISAGHRQGEHRRVRKNAKALIEEQSDQPVGDIGRVVPGIAEVRSRRVRRAVDREEETQPAGEAQQRCREKCRESPPDTVACDQPHDDQDVERGGKNRKPGMEPRKNREGRAMEEPSAAVIPGGYNRCSRAHERPDTCEDQHPSDAVWID